MFSYKSNIVWRQIFVAVEVREEYALVHRLNPQVGVDVGSIRVDLASVRLPEDEADRLSKMILVELIFPRPKTLTCANDRTPL